MRKKPKIFNLFFIWKFNI